MVLSDGHEFNIADCRAQMKEERLKLDQSEDAGQEDDYLDDLGTTRMARDSPTHTREGLFKKKIPFW